MFVAFDSDGNRVYADSAVGSATYYCPACNETLKLRSGSVKKTHFAHLPGTDCYYGRDNDYKSEWHIRMQEYFLRETREVRFVDETTGEIHIADIFIADSNTVLEFQHSPIPANEFIGRTAFHLKNGRRIVWLFDESSQGKRGSFGRFRLDEDFSIAGKKYYKWMYQPRHCLSMGPILKEVFDRYSVCVYTGTEGDVFHRVVDQQDQYQWVAFSEKTIQMEQGLNIEQFFEFDSVWLNDLVQRKERLTYQPPVLLRSVQKGNRRKTRL